MRYKDEVKGSAELNWLNDLLESQTIEAITINRKTAELLLNYADKALATQEYEQAGVPTSWPSLYFPALVT